MFANLAGVLFDGVAYGSLLFLISIGLSVTLGLMNFINLAHGAFAMLGGYVCTMAMARIGVPFLATLPLAFVAAAAAGAVLEPLLYRRLYRASPLDQVLFSIGLTLMSVAQIRACVDNAQASAGLGINVNRVFGVSFTLGSGLAGLGGALAIDVLGLDPTFPLKYLVYFLLVVVVGGAGSVAGTLIASIVVGVFDVAGKYYVPAIGAFVIYGLMLVLLLLFPGGLRRSWR